jgi:hypothetical protein
MSTRHNAVERGRQGGWPRPIPETQTMVHVTRHVDQPWHPLVVQLRCHECRLLPCGLFAVVPDPDWLEAAVFRLRLRSHQLGWRRRTVTDHETGRPVRADLCPGCLR